MRSVKQAGCCFTVGYKIYFLHIIHTVILYRSSYKWLKLQRDGHFPSYPLKHPFHSYPFPPGASREELLLYHCGLSGKIHLPVHLLWSRRGPQTVRHPAITHQMMGFWMEEVNSNTHICKDAFSATLCFCAAASLPPPRIIFVHLSAMPMEHSKNGCCAIHLNFPNLLTFFVWPASPRDRSLKTVVVQQLW